MADNNFSPIRVGNGKGGKKCSYYTQEGHPLTAKEEAFINHYIKTNNGAESARLAGYPPRSARQQANELLSKPYLALEIKARMDAIHDATIAEADEILQYLTSVMRGEIKDQFGLEAPLAERTKAAQELARRRIDIAAKVDGKDVPEVRITLDWGNNNGES